MTLVELLARLPDLLIQAAKTAEADALAVLAAGQGPRGSARERCRAARASESLTRIESPVAVQEALPKLKPIIKSRPFVMPIKPIITVQPLVAGKKSGLSLAADERLRAALAVFRQSFYREVVELWNRLEDYEPQNRNR